MEGSRFERVLQDVLDALVGAFAGWTAGYQMGFALRLSAYLDAATGFALAVAAVVLVLRWRGSESYPGDAAPGARLAVAAVLSAALALAVMSTLMNRPDADDITFFPRAAAQLSHLGQPILTHETTSDVPGLPGPAVGYLLTSYEFLVALVARGLGLNPLSAYQNGGGAVGSALVPPVYYLLFRRLGLRPLIAIAAVGGVVTFLLLDGNDHYSMGNFAFVRLWQGKAILLTLLPPFALAQILDFFRSGGRRPWLCTLYAGIGATGLSTVGCFFAPAYVVVATVAVGVGLLLARQLDWRALVRRALLLLLATAYPLIVLIAVVIAPFAGTVGPLEWSRVAKSDQSGQMAMSDLSIGWSRQLLLPASSIPRMVWALCLVVVAPLLALPRPRALAIALFAPVFVILVANPVLGGLLYRAVPDVYWRFYYLLPIPLCCGLLVAALAQAISAPGRARYAAAKAVAAAVLVVAFAVTVSLATFSPANVGFSWKKPAAWKLDAPTVASLGPSLPALSGRRVLADEPAAVALALIDPSIHVLAQRPPNTLVAFALAGRLEDGQARVQAQAVAAGATASAPDLAAFSRVIASGADAVVVRTGAVETVEPLLASSGGTWRRIGSDGLYTIYLKQVGR